MKKLLLISLCALAALGVAACGTAAPASIPDSNSAPSISVLPSPPPESASVGESSRQEPPIPADAAMYRGTVTAVSSADPPADGTSAPLLEVTLEQAEGTDFGAPALKFAFTADTRADFTPEEGQYLEVYYGRAPGQPLDAKETHDILTAIKYHSADMVVYNGTVKAIQPHPDKPNQGWLILVPLGMDLTEVYPTTPAAPGEPFIGNPEIHYNYDKDKTKFYVNFDEIKVGDNLNIFQSGAMTMSLPPQAFAIEVRRYVAPIKVDIPKAAAAIDPNAVAMEMKFDQSVYTGKEKALYYTITNMLSRDFGFGMYEQFQYKTDGAWADYPAVKDGYPDIAIIAPANSSTGDSVDLSYYEAPLPVGSYRIVRKFGDKEYYAEFTVE